MIDSIECVGDTKASLMTAYFVEKWGALETPYIPDLGTWQSGIYMSSVFPSQIWDLGVSCL